LTRASGIAASVTPFRLTSPVKINVAIHQPLIHHYRPFSVGLQLQRRE